MCYGRTREVALPEGAAAGVRGRAPDHFLMAEMWPEEPTACVTIAAMAGGESFGATGEGRSRHCWRGECRHTGWGNRRRRRIG